MERLGVGFLLAIGAVDTTVEENAVLDAEQMQGLMDQRVHGPPQHAGLLLAAQGWQLSAARQLEMRRVASEAENAHSVFWIGQAKHKVPAVGRVQVPHGQHQGAIGVLGPNGFGHFEDVVGPKLDVGRVGVDARLELELLLFGCRILQLGDGVPLAPAWRMLVFQRDGGAHHDGHTQISRGELGQQLRRGRGVAVVKVPQRMDGDDVTRLVLVRFAVPAHKAAEGLAHFLLFPQPRTARGHVHRLEQGAVVAEKRLVAARIPFFRRAGSRSLRLAGHLKPPSPSSLGVALLHFSLSLSFCSGVAWSR